MAITGYNIHDAANKVAQKVDGTTAVNVGQGRDKKRTNSGTHDVDGELVRGLDDGNVECLASC